MGTITYLFEEKCQNFLTEKRIALSGAMVVYIHLTL